MNPKGNINIYWTEVILSQTRKLPTVKCQVSNDIHWCDIHWSDISSDIYVIIGFNQMIDMKIEKHLLINLCVQFVS